MTEGVTTTKGLGMPRVFLTDPNSLVDIAPDNAVRPDPTEHTGLVVYNTNKCLNYTSYDDGLYVWDGKMWEYIGNEPTITLSPNVRTFVDNRDSSNPVTYHYRTFGGAGTWMLENMAAKRFMGSSVDIDFYDGIGSYTNPQIAYPQMTGATSDWSEIPTTWVIQQGLLYNWAAATNNYNPGFDQGQIDPTTNGGNPGPNEVESVGPDGPSIAGGYKYVQGICPNGWHIPSDREWNQLEKEFYTNPNLYSTTLAGIFSPISWYSLWEFGSHPDPGYGGRGTSFGGGHGGAMRSICAPPGSLPERFISGKSFSSEQGGFNFLNIGWIDNSKVSSQEYGVVGDVATSSRMNPTVYRSWNRRLSTSIVSRTYTIDSSLIAVRCKQNQQ